MAAKYQPGVLRAILWGLLVTGLLAVLIVVGSRRLSHFDAALVGYTFATLFAAFGITYRYCMWLQRPPTALYWKRGWQMFLRPRWLGRNLVVWLKRLVGIFALNNFIWRRGILRGAAHWLIMWGCIIAALITFPLVFGWIHFETAGGDFERYRLVVFGWPTFAFRAQSLLGGLIFHGLAISAVMVIAGVMLAMRRRMRDRDAAALQQFGEDFLPLILLFAISVTGLMLVVSYEWMHGYAYEFLAILHAVTVIFTLLWLPFGKFFHIFQRPAQLGVSFYKDAGARGEPARCVRCGDAFASRMHVEDLIEVERQLGYRYEMAEEPARREPRSPDNEDSRRPHKKPDSERRRRRRAQPFAAGAEGPGLEPGFSRAGHYQWVCPRCRRSLLAVAQGRLWQEVQTTSFPSSSLGTRGA